ncbi:chain length determinant protein EpsF [Aquabacterium olei]|uniref:Chain length determinant protein EpsF n=1 Tax=Aquabacterium olei TaxID=1296669 RepID=A0A2U8FTP9_9BURK|nr:chain length determinant protein EpsF [Aquabacterium olei]AWI54425.1 chain length determinant protein EpsF [Aquabacterium olei]
MSFADFLRVLRARWILALTTLLAVVILALVGSLLWPKKYTAKAVVMVDMKMDPVAGTSTIGVMPSAAYLATQVDIIESGHVARKVVRAMNLAQNTAMREEWADATRSEGDFEAWLADKVGKNLKVAAARESNVIEIEYESADPGFSAALANAYAKAYMDSTVQFKTAPARQYSDFFEERARLARQKMESAQAKLSQAQQDKGIVVTDERLDVETAKLNDLAGQVTTLRGVMADASSRRSQAVANAEISPDAMSNTVISSLKGDLARQEAQLDQSLERFGEQHPTIVELRAAIASTRAKIRAEVGRVSSSLNASSQISSSRASAIQAAYEEQRQKVLKMKQDRNDLLVLEREVEAAQRVFDAIQARQSQMSLEGSNSQTNIVVLGPATAPTSPSSPRLALNLVLATLLGGMLSLGLTLGAEFLDRRVRSASDVTTLIELPVIGTLPGPNARQGRLPWSGGATRLPGHAIQPASSGNVQRFGSLG